MHDYWSFEEFFALKQSSLNILLKLRSSIHVHSLLRISDENWCWFIPATDRLPRSLIRRDSRSREAGDARKKVKYARKRIELTTSLMYTGMTSSPWARPSCEYTEAFGRHYGVICAVCHGETLIYMSRESTLVEHLDLPGISFGCWSFRCELFRLGLPRVEICLFSCKRWNLRVSFENETCDACFLQETKFVLQYFKKHTFFSLVNARQINYFIWIYSYRHVHCLSIYFLKFGRWKNLLKHNFPEIIIIE